MRYGGLVVALQGAGIVAVCATFPLEQSGVETAPAKRVLYTGAAAAMSAMALGIVRGLSRGRLVALRVNNWGLAEVLSRRWWDPTGKLVVAAAVPSRAGSIRVSYSQLATAAGDRSRARMAGPRRKQMRAEEGVLAIRVGGDGEEGRMFTVDARECDVFDEKALRAIAVDADRERGALPPSEKGAL